MSHRANLCYFWLLGAAALLGIGAAPCRAQDQTKPAEPAVGTDEKKADSTPWPPPNTEMFEIKRDEEQKQGLKLYVPKSWKKTEPKISLRLAQFTIPPAKGDKEPVELAINSFKGSAGGGVQPNVERWINQFQPKGRKVKVTTGEGKQGVYVLADIQGTYLGPSFAKDTRPLPDARMLAVIVGIRWEEPAGEGDEKKTVTKSAIYFLKMAGPEKTVSQNEKALRAAFGAADKENDLEQREEPADSEK